MDLRSIINDAEVPSVPRPARDPASQESPTHAGSPSGLLSSPQASRAYGPPGPTIHTGRASRPPPPPAVDVRSPGASSAYTTAHSPYQTTSPASSGAGNQYPFPTHAPGFGVGQAHYHGMPKDGPSIMVPSAPTPSHPHAPLSAPNSASSAPTSAGSYYHGQPYTPRHPQASPTTLPSPMSQTLHTGHESPASSHSQGHPHMPPHYPHQSQPGTPLGPPSAYASSVKGYGHGQAAAPWNEQSHASPGMAGPSAHDLSSSSRPQPRDEERGGPVSERRRSSHGDSEGHGRNDHEYLAQRERERSLSVSPKTRLPDSSAYDASNDGRWNGQVTPAKRKLAPIVEDEHGHHASPVSDSSPASVNGVNHAQATTQPASASTGPGRPYYDPVLENGPVRKKRPSSSSESRARPAERPAEESPSVVKEPESKQHSTTPRSSGRASPTAQASPNDPASQPVVSPSGPAPGVTSGAHVAGVKVEASAQSRHAPAAASAPPQAPARKRTRYDEPPIFARRASGSTSSSPVISNRRQPGAAATSVAPVKVEPKESSTEPQSATKDGHGPRAAVDDGAVPLPQGQPPRSDDGPLGAWEPSITNVIPSEEITRKIMDFLFLEVVERKDVGGSGSGPGPVPGVQLEIEAKLGQLIDKNTNERVRLPVLTECIFNKDHPSWRTAFRSSMTESQHRRLNQFLNEAVLSSNPRLGQASANDGTAHAAAKPRIPLHYVHTRELDRFYELPPSHAPAIPLSVRPHANQRHRMRVRVTHDQKTGEQLAQIIKIRIADLDVYSPRTAFDWRLSVNLEMAYDGDTNALVEIVENGRSSKRSKDRMTYRHLAYQIDLTQVTMQPDPSSIPPSSSASVGKVEKEHELEVEVSAQRIREQGLLAKAGQPTQYEDLVKGFIDNVRVLARVVGHPG